MREQLPLWQHQHAQLGAAGRPRRPANGRHPQQGHMCDLCHDVPGAEKEVSCVFACPHHAAFRMSGPDLLQLVAADR